MGPGQKVDIPESKDEAPLPKVDAPNPLGSFFGGETCKHCIVQPSLSIAGQQAEAAVGCL